jgi:hypothetical protein
MPIKIEITAEGASDLKTHVTQLSEVFGLINRVPPSEQATATVPTKRAKKATVAAQATTEGDAGAAQAAQIPVQQEEPIFDETPTAPAAVKAWTFLEVDAKVREIVTKKGMNDARALLNKFGAARTSAVKEADYPTFMAEALTLLGEK